MDRAIEQMNVPVSENCLSGGGEMGALMRAMDWSATPLAAVESWPQSLRTAISICLSSRFPMLIWWGNELVMLYNDAYRPILGTTKHPQAMGQRGRECWPEVWDIIGPMLEGVMATGQSTWSDDQLLLLDRNSYIEECYFTFSYSPIRDETGKVGGVFTAVTETTQRVLGERRLYTLRDLANRTVGTKTAQEACEVTAKSLANNAADIPFALIYLLDKDNKQAHLVSTTGLNPETLSIPKSVDLVETEDEDIAGIWPLAKVASTGQAKRVDRLRARFACVMPQVPSNFPDSALVLPIAQANQAHPAGLLVVGVSPRRELDDDYRSFFELVAGQVATAIANARGYEEERKRAEALAELDQEKTAFFSNVSHEFRTPLTLLLGPIEEMLNNPEEALSPHQRQQLDTVHRNSLRLLKLVNSLLDFSRIEAGRVQAVYEPTALSTFTAELASVFRSAIEKAGLRLVVDCPPLPELVYIDQDMWEKIVLNLLSNAFKFTFEGEITVSQHWTGEGVMFKVRDTGIGIPAEELPHLFERFHRVRGARSRTHEGTGIGLALVQELVRLHGGTVEVASVVNQGTTFTVTIPAGWAHLPSDRIRAPRTQASTAIGTAPYIEEALRWLPEQESGVRSQESGVGSRESGVRSQGSGVRGQESGVRGQGSGVRSQEKIPASDSWILNSDSWIRNSDSSATARILLVDDNADMRDYVKRLLQHHYQVEAVEDGLAALAAVRSRIPDLVLTDVMMPGLDGFGLLRELRADAKTREIPIIVLSARAGEESRIQGLEAGADDYLIKPFSANELLARVKANLSQARMRREATLREQSARADAETAQQKVTHILESITDGFASFDKQWRYTYVNQEAARLVYKTPEELIGKNVWEEFPEAVGGRFYQEYHRALAEQVSIEFEEFYPPLNTWFHIRIYPSSDGISVYYQDISKRKQVEEALQHSEARYRQIVETSYEGIWTIDAQGQTDFVNQRMAQMLGYTVEEMLGRSVFDFMDETARIEAEQKFEQRMQGLNELHEFRWRRKDGSDLWTLVSTNAILNERGEFLGAIGMVSDISARKKAEDSLGETNQTLNSLVQACPLAITVFSLDDGRVKLWNPAAERIFGWSEHEALGHFLPTIPEDKKDEFLANLSAITQGRELTGLELRRQKRDGSPIDIAVWANVMQDAKGELNCISILADISDRKRLEEELRSALMKLTSHVENSPLGVVEWDREFRVTRWSKQAEKLFGWQASEVLGKRPLDWQFVYAEDFEATKSILQRLTNGTEQRNVSANRNYTKDGKLVYCEWYNSALFDESGKMASVLSLVLDVTERKQVEAELAREALERQRLLKLEQKARAEAEAANRIKDEFLAVLSHELRSPLNPILGWTNLLRTRKSDEKTQLRALEIIERNAKLLTQLIEDLLDVSRILRGKLSLNISSVNLKSTIEAAIETVRLAAQAKSIQITTVFEPNVGLVTGDGNRLQQVVWNLLSNAVKFTPSEGCVEVSLSLVDSHSSFEGTDALRTNDQGQMTQYAQIQVRDTGKGINPDFLPYVFDYFRQADSTTTRAFGGLGLGLAIVRNLVELHGGTVHAESPGDGLGATFTVRLPLMTTHAQTTFQSQQQPDRLSELNGTRILVVDDEADMREFLAFLLEEHGAEVTVVASASEALEALERVKPDLLLSDIGMPDVDGYMLMRQIKAMPPEQGGEIPAIALTAYAGDTDRKRVLEAGFQEHIPKPVEPDKLLAAIGLLLTPDS